MRIIPRVLRPLIAICGLFALVGCAGGMGPQKPVLVVDASDPCAQQRSEFAGSKTYFTAQIVGDIGAGALIGGAGGLALGLATGMNPIKAAAAGAVAGGAIGGVSGYSKVMAEKHRDQAELAKSVNDDLTKEGQEIDHTSASFARLRTCRFAEAAQIKQAVRRRHLDRPTALDRIGKQKALFAEEIALAKDYNVSMDKRGQEFQEAVDTIKAQEASDQQHAAAAAAQTQAVRQAAAISIPDKRSSFKRSVASAEANSDVAFNLDNNKRVSSLRLPQQA